MVGKEVQLTSNGQAVAPKKASKGIYTSVHIAAQYLLLTVGSHHSCDILSVLPSES